MPAKDEDAVLKKFGANVRARRERHRLSQEAFADEAGLDRTYVGGIERGERNPTLLSARRIAKALDASIAELCKGIDS